MAFLPVQLHSSLSLTQDELAAKLLEKKNVISSIERGDLLPEIKTARGIMGRISFLADFDYLWHWI